MRYLVTLLSVARLVQRGSEARADRYAYGPLVGLAIAVAWTAQDLVRGRGVPDSAIIVTTAAALLACAVVTRHQLAFWQSSMSLWQRAGEVSLRSYEVEANLGHLNLADGKLNEAADHLTEAARLAPNAPEVHFDLATVLADRGQLEEAVAEYSAALRIRPEY